MNVDWKTGWKHKHLCLCTNGMVCHIWVCATVHNIAGLAQFSLKIKLSLKSLNKRGLKTKELGVPLHLGLLRNALFSGYFSWIGTLGWNMIIQYRQEHLEKKVFQVRAPLRAGLHWDLCWTAVSSWVISAIAAMLCWSSRHLLVQKWLYPSMWDLNTGIFTGFVFWNWLRKNNTHV